MFGYRHEPLQCHRSVLSRVRPHKLQCSEHHSTRLKRKQCYTQGVSQTNISCFRNLLPVERGGRFFRVSRSVTIYLIPAYGSVVFNDENFIMLCFQEG